MPALFAGGRKSLLTALFILLILLTACGDNTTPGPSGSGVTVAATATTAAQPTMPVAATAAPADTAVAATLVPTAVPQVTIELPPAPTTQPTPSGVDEDQQVAIYALVARDLITESQSQSGATGVPPYIGISQKAGQGELLDTSASGVMIPDGLIDELADLGTTIAFADFSTAIGSLDDGGKVQNGGVYLTFSPLSADPVGGGYQLYASYYHAVDDAAGYSYVIDHETDAWVIKDRKQVWTR